MRKAAIGIFISALLLLTGADCQGSKPNPKPRPGPSWIEPCSTTPVDCPVQTGRQPAPTGSAG